LRRQENVSNPGTDRKGKEEEAFNKKKKGEKRKMRSPYLTNLIAVRARQRRFSFCARFETPDPASESVAGH
jgi:hypothetical protein